MILIVVSGIPIKFKGTIQAFYQFESLLSKKKKESKLEFRLYLTSYVSLNIYWELETALQQLQLRKKYFSITNIPTTSRDLRLY